MILKNFWVLEGLDGAGTTTQLHNIQKFLESGNIDSFITHEPTDNETGKIIRRVLSGEIKVPQSVIARMFAADRDDHLNNPEYGIIKKTESGIIAVSDRYLFSSIAYQSIGFSYEKVEELNKDFPLPELLIFIDTPPEDCIKRIDSRGGNKEIYEKLEYQREVKAGYEKCIEKLPQECKVLRIDGTKSKDEIFQIIESMITDLLKARRKGE